VLYAEKDVIGKAGIDLPAPGLGAAAPAVEMAIPRGDSRALTREHVVELLRRNNGIVERAAKDAQVSRTTLFRKIKKFGL
jgi:transcriptional regulator of acetoin/glycerol metabolism